MMRGIDFSKCNKIIRVILFIGKAKHIKSGSFGRSVYASSCLSGNTKLGFLSLVVVLFFGFVLLLLL